VLKDVKGAKAQEDSAAVNTDALREQAKQTLLEATSSGKLDAALKHAKGTNAQSANTEVLREQAKQTLLEATSSGKLDAALKNVKGAKSNVSEERLDSLRTQAKQTLLQATSSGQLDAALKNVRGAKSNVSEEDDTEALRQQAQQTLLRATETGHLDEALRKVKAAQEADEKTEADEQSSQPVAQKTLSQIEPLRKQVQGVLLQATQDGELDAALKAVGGSDGLDEQKALSRPAAERGESLFSRVDADHDERITRAEFKDAQQRGILPSDEASSALVPAGVSLPSDGMSAEELQMTLANGLREAINESVKGAVGDVVNNAFAQLKEEMEKRDAQAEVLAEKMHELSKSVTDLQGTVHLPDTTKQASP
jgi:hypothetical protein